MEGALSMIALVAVVVSAGAITVAAHFRKERVTELHSWAREHGWEYAEHDDPPLEGATLPDALLGHSPRVRHVLRGVRGRHRVVMFELTLVGGRRGGETVHRVVAVSTPGPGADLEIHRRDLARTVSFDGRGAPEEVRASFSAAFHVVGADAHFTRAVLDHATASWLLSDWRSRSFPLRFTGEHLLTWAPMGLDPARALTAADYLIALVERVPDQAWEHHTAGS
ncbi:hypothetical protein [Nocardiopsis sp. MG754419]|uniref:hypothetical protein n=1 Tax=Nocardiopsis sp. MG754419 TaxID=2259865 RepID=UPI001BAA98DA|nr:hypothetical protein [Nocardiopsis sp. MG754419]MBR8744077.1 hypothetical protein [Nocardiopsis sp. MG754419]